MLAEKGQQCGAFAAFAQLLKPLTHSLIRLLVVF
jgi:hypothetical protein